MEAEDAPETRVWEEAGDRLEDGGPGVTRSAITRTGRW